MLISQNSHERIGEIPAEPGCRFRGNRNGYRRLDGQIAGAVAGQVEYGRLAREKSRFGSGNNGGKARAAPSFNPLVGQARLVRSAAPRRTVRAIFRTASRLAYVPRRSGRRSLDGLGRRAGRSQPDVGERIHQPGIDGQTLSLDHPGVGRNRSILANCEDHAARDNYGCIFNGRTGYRNDSGSTNGEVLRLTTLREEWRTAGQKEKQRQHAATRRQTNAGQSRTHAELLVETRRSTDRRSVDRIGRLRLLGSFR